MKSSADLTVFVNLNGIYSTCVCTISSLVTPSAATQAASPYPSAAFTLTFSKWEEASVSCCHPLAANSSVALSLTGFAQQLNTLNFKSHEETRTRTGPSHLD